VIEGRVRTTNLPWTVDAAALARKLGLPGVGLLNDLEANAWAVEWLPPGDLSPIQEGAPGAAGNVAVMAAGTGLGEAALVRGGGTTVSLASEGGHADFAPRQDVEVELLRHLRAKFGHVSYERVVSGPGLLNVYEFLRDSGRGEEPAWLAEDMRRTDPPAAISEAALAGKCALCELALDLFLGVYGAEAGNLALRTMATGGVYLGGGIAPKIFGRRPGHDPARSSRSVEAFRQAFVDKGRFGALLETIPVRVILNDKAALLGAARYASRAAPS
jgi:glucokinase